MYSTHTENFDSIKNTTSYITYKLSETSEINVSVFRKNITSLQASYDSYVQRLQGVRTKGYTTKETLQLACAPHVFLYCVRNTVFMTHLIPMQVAVKIMNKQSLGVCFALVRGSMSSKYLICLVCDMNLQ